MEKVPVTGRRTKLAGIKLFMNAFEASAHVHVGVIQVNNVRLSNICHFEVFRKKNMQKKCDCICVMLVRETSLCLSYSRCEFL